MPRSLSHVPGTNARTWKLVIIYTRYKSTDINPVDMLYAHLDKELTWDDPLSDCITLTVRLPAKIRPKVD